MYIKLTEPQRKNLIEFMSRTTMTGKELPAYIELVEIINRPISEKEEGD